MSSSQRPLPDNTQQPQQTDIHAPLGFEPTISAGEQSHTYALDRSATGTGKVHTRNTHRQFAPTPTPIFLVKLRLCIRVHINKSRRMKCYTRQKTGTHTEFWLETPNKRGSFGRYRRIWRIILLSVLKKCHGCVNWLQVA